MASISEILDNFVDDEIGSEVGEFLIHRHPSGNVRSIWYGWKTEIKGKGNKQDWKDGANRLIDILSSNHFGRFQVDIVLNNGAVIERL